MQLTPIKLLVTFTLLTCWAPQPLLMHSNLRRSPSSGICPSLGNSKYPSLRPFSKSCARSGGSRGRTSPLNPALRKGDPSGSPPWPQLIQPKVDVLVTFPFLAAQAAKHATTRPPSS